MSEQKLLPELRFSEFFGEWDTTKLGDIAQFSKGKSISKGDIDLDGKTPCIRYGELYTDYSEKIEIILSKTNLPSEELTFSLEEDVIIPSSGESHLDIATASCVMKSGIALGGDLNIIRSPLNGIFLSYQLNNAKKKAIARLAQGNSVVHLYNSQLAHLSIEIPKFTEQKKIADFLSSVDAKLAKLNRKKTLLQDYKRGLMQQIFSQKLRFKQDDGSEFPEWESIVLSEIASFSKGKSISKGDVVENGKTLCIRYGELYTHYSEKIQEVLSRTNVPKSELAFSFREDVIIPSSGESHLDIATASCVLKEGIALGSDLNIIRGDFNGVFLAYYLNTAKKKDIARLAQGNSVVHLYNSQLSNLQVCLPSIKEQQKIADFLSSVDQKIDAESKQIAQLQSFKKGLLQKLFV